MEQSQAFASEWQELKNQHYQIIAEIDKLKRKLNNLSTELGMDKKGQLKKQEKEIALAIESCNDDINKMHEVLSWRKRALAHEKTRQDIIYTVSKQKQYLHKIAKSDLKRIARHRQFIWELTAPLLEVEQYLQTQEAILRQNIQEMRRTLQSISDSIVALDNCYSQMKDCLKAQLETIEHQQRQQCNVMLEWATQDREHLKWIIQNDPSYKDRAISKYKERFLDDNISDLLPNTVIQETVNLPKPIRKNDNVIQEDSIEHTVQKPQAWKFFIAAGPSALGEELPQDQIQFLERVQAILNKNGLAGLKAKFIYDTLIGITQLTMGERQLTITKIIEPELHGWQRKKKGKYRILVHIDENLRQIRFIPRKRDRKTYPRN